MIGYPNFIMDPKELDKVFNDVSGFRLPLKLPESHVRQATVVAINLYQRDVGRGLGIRA